MSPVTTRIPSLGPRGEGWLAAQFVLLALIGALGFAELAGHGLASPWGTPALAMGIVLAGFGLALGARAIHDLGSALSPFPKPLAAAPLIETGAFRWIRHPIYTGLLLAATGWGLAAGSLPALAATVALALVLDAKSRREESWLLAAHPGYAAYRRRTRRFVPLLY